MLLFCYLPPSYKTFKETLIYDRDELSFEDVKGNLLSKEKLDSELDLSSKSSSQASFLVARGRQQSKDSCQNKSRSRSKSRNRDKTCNYYKKLGGEAEGGGSRC